MTSTVRRAGAIAGLSTLTLAVPLFGPAVGLVIAASLFLVALFVRNGPLFELLALPGDRVDGRLYSLAALVVAGVALGSVAAATSLSWAVFVGTLLLVGYGDLAAELGRRWGADDATAAGVFCVGGALAAVAGAGIVAAVDGTVSASAVPGAVFLATAGALMAAVIRDKLPRYDDPLVVLVVGSLLWLLAELDPQLGGSALAVALVVTVALGYLSYVLETASVAGMLTGVLLGLLTIVLGGWGWFVVLISFFGIGGLSTKYRYDEKAARGVAEDNEGARGSANVFSNSAVALAAVLGYAASDVGLFATDPDLFRFAFAGAVATALADTLSSEIGGVYERPRLITTFEPVAPGTDGGVTWQGELAGFAGASIVAAIAVALFPVGILGATVIVVAGFVGMTVDSLLGATVEGRYVGNQGVNFLATLAGALVGALLVSVGLG